MFYVLGQSPSDACTARFETSEVTEFAFSRAAPGWVTSVAAPVLLLQRERKSVSAQESVRVSVGKKSTFVYNAAGGER